MTAREAGPKLLVLAQWESEVQWLLEHSQRWPKSLRFTLTQRVQNHALDIVELLVQARYEPLLRAEILSECN